MTAKDPVFTPTATHEQPLSTRAMRRLGDLLQMEIHSHVDMVRISRAGVPAVAVQRLAQIGFSQQDLSWVIHRNTLRRRQQKQQVLTPEESDRWLRAAKLQTLATEVLGTADKASQWLHKPRKIFDGMSAMEIMQTEAGGQLVEEVLGQLDAGYFA